MRGEPTFVLRPRAFDGALRFARDLPRLIVAAMLLRALLAIGLWFAFGQREFTDDVAFHLSLASDPFYLFGCRQPQWVQQPPLLGLAETSLLPWVSVLGPFFGVRLGYALWDLAGSVLLLRGLRVHGWDTPVVRLLLLFGPLNLYASAVSAQDETVTWFFACASMALLLAQRQGVAFLLACIGVVMAKILFVPLALALAPTLLRRGQWPWLILGAAVIATVYAWSASCQYPAARYVLAAAHTINAWQWIVPASGMDWAQALRLSALSVLGLGLPAVALISYRSVAGSGSPRLAWPDPVLATVLGLFAFLAAFYHVVPEYFLMLVPLLLVHLLRGGARPAQLMAALLVVGALPIIPDVLRFLVRYQLSPMALAGLHQLACALLSGLCLLAMSLLLAKRARVRSGIGTGQDA